MLQIVFHTFEFLTNDYWYFCNRIDSCIALYRTKHSFQEHSNKGAFRSHIASNKRLIHIIIYVKYFVILKTLQEVLLVCTVSRRRLIVSQRRFFVSQQVGTIGHVRYINILTWLRGFRDKLLYLLLFSLY